MKDILSWSVFVQLKRNAWAELVSRAVVVYIYIYIYVFLFVRFHFGSRQVIVIALYNEAFTHLRIEVVLVVSDT